MASRADEAQGRALQGGAMGAAGVVFFVIAAAAPLTVIVASAPLAIGMGNGQGAPGAYVLTALLLSLFAVGYAAMSRHVTNAGAFYAYIALGLGPAAGAAAMMPVGYAGLMLKPHGFFDANPALDVPQPNARHHGQSSTGSQA